MGSCGGLSWESTGFDHQAPTALLVGRWQPFHAGHLALATEAAGRHGQVAFGVRDTVGTTEKDPFCYGQIEGRIISMMRKERFPWPFMVFQVPNVAGIYYGRDVGYAVERIGLSAELEAVSGTALRAAM